MAPNGWGGNFPQFGDGAKENDHENPMAWTGTAQPGRS